MKLFLKCVYGDNKDNIDTYIDKIKIFEENERRIEDICLTSIGT
jgi:hypothetical protein